MVNSMIRRARTFLLPLLLAAVVSAQDLDDHASRELGFLFSAPAAGWEKVDATDRIGGGTEYVWREAGDESRTVSLIVWRITDVPSLESLCASERRQMAERGEVEEIAEQSRRVAEHDGRATRYRLTREGEEATAVIDATYFRTDDFLGRLAVTLPADEIPRLDALVEHATAAFRVETPPPRPVSYDHPVPGNVLTVVHGTRGDDLVYRYLEALPRASIVIAVESSLEDAARDFIEKFRPARIYLLGPPHDELPGAIEEHESPVGGGPVVVSARNFRDAAAAACFATKRGLPLLIADRSFADRLERWRPSDVYVVGEVEVDVENAHVFRYPDPGDLPDGMALGTGYLAVANMAEGGETVALAVALAAARGGMVLPLDMPMTRRSIPLQRTDECPPGLEEIDGRGHYLTARIETDAGPVLVGAAQTSVVRVATHESPRYGRLRIDLDGDGSLESDEEPRIGTRITVGGTAYHLNYHYRHDFVPYFGDELLLDAFDPEAIRDAIRAVACEHRDLKYVAIVGTPASVPFCYREATGYFEAYDIKQDLPTDAPYADLDDDGYLEFAVGRLPVEDLISGSTIIATTLAYPRLPGDWAERATAIQPGFYEKEGSLPWVLPNAEALVRGIEGDLAHAGVEVEGFYRSDVKIDEVLESISRSGWIAYFNHSGPGAWGIHPGSSIVTGTPGGANDRTLPPLVGAPIVFGGGCSSAALDVGQPGERTFAGRFFQLGAVAYLGNTRVASARSSPLVQLFFARLAGGEHTLGEAYRDGRNFLAHLLEGGHLLEPLDEGVEQGIRDFLWGQHAILNLFGDPALEPRGVHREEPLVEVAMEAIPIPDHYRLTVRYHGADRRDPIQMMPAAGQGTPREFFARTGPGLTTSWVPPNFVEDGLSPVRSRPAIQPGAWIDMVLPGHKSVQSLTLLAGPQWCDRGYTVRRGVRDEARLQMFVPFVHASFEQGDGEFAREVIFELALTDCAPEEAGRSVARIHAPERWEPVRIDSPVVTLAAARIVERVRERYARPPSFATVAAHRWSIANPQPRLYGEEAAFDGGWNAEGIPEVTALLLPELLEVRRDEIEDAVEWIAALPFADPLPELAGMRVDATDGGALLLVPEGKNLGEAITVVYVGEDGLVTRWEEREFGLTRRTELEWRESKLGPLLSRRTHFDFTQPEHATVHAVIWELHDETPLPERVVLRKEGRLPRDYSFRFRYRRAY